MTTELTFHVPPRNQGQMVEQSYAADHERGEVIRRTADASARTIEYHASPLLAGDEGEYWNAPPRNRRWHRLDSAELARLGLA
jgi:hypothetical protein